MIADQIKQKLGEALTKVAPSMSVSPASLTLSHPENSQYGDFASSISLQLTKELKLPPMQIAEQIVAAIEKGDLIEKLEVVKPGFINIFIKSEILLEEAKKLASPFDSKKVPLTEINKDKEAIVEYSSPNIAKPFTIGHLRSTIIGDAVANVLQATGYKVYRDNHLGDWGTQFGKQIYAIKHIGENNEEKIETAERPIAELVKLYIAFHDEAEKHPEIEDKAREYFKQLEDGDAEMKRLWTRCIEWSFKEFDLIYKKLGVSFSENNGRGYGESFFEDKMTVALAELKEKLPNNYKAGKDNAQLLFFDNDKYPPLMILKQDGATLYSTRDLATDYFRKTTYPNVSLIVNEVGAEQSLYFQQLYEIEKLLGWYTDGQRVHVKHGLYRFKDMKMSTRKGNVIWLEDVLEEAKKRATELSKDQPDIAEIVGLGALKWNDLKRSSHLDIVFDWDDILSMQGNSGPYMQYAYVRTLSILNKESLKSETELSTKDLNEDDLSMLKQFYIYPEVVELAAKNYAPHLLTTYLFDLAQRFNLFYQKNPILKADDSLKQVRLLITQATSNILKDGLSLLGIQTVEKM